MSDFEQKFLRFLEACKRNPEGKELIKERNHIFQFTLTDKEDEPFYIEIKDSNITAKKGSTSIDYNGMDFDKATLVTTDKESIKDIMFGKHNITWIRFQGRWDFSNRVGAKSIHMWFGSLIRMAQEQIQQEGMETYLKSLSA